MTAPLLALLLAAAAASEPEVRQENEQKTERRFDALAVPLVSFNSDEGFGFGVVGGVYLYGEKKPYDHGIAAQLYATTGRIQSHFLRYDGPRFLGTRLRLEARVELRRERFAPYFGEGNESAPEFRGEERSPFYSYVRGGGGAWLRLRYKVPGSALEPYLGYSFRQTSVRVPPGSLLERDAPLGIEGGPTGQVLAGIARDTRDQEADPSRGGTEEVAIELASRPTASRYDYGQATVVVRRFVPFGERFVLAGRLVFDWLFGEVPFYELNTTGGLAPAEGIGGTSSVRGVVRHRYTGRLKLLGNLELRAVVVEPVILKARTRFMALAFLDAGRAWAAGLSDGPWYRLHGGAGLGVRVVRGAAVVRFDYGIARDRQAVYLTFGHQF